MPRIPTRQDDERVLKLLHHVSHGERMAVAALRCGWGEDVGRTIMSRVRADDIAHSVEPVADFYRVKRRGRGTR